MGKPGRYPLTTNMKVADLIQVGGGLKPSAFTDSADLTRFEFAPGGQLAGHGTKAVAMTPRRLRRRFSARARTCH